MNFVKNKIKYVILSIISIIFLLIFFNNYYKTQNTGNTINIKSKEEFITYVKNIRSYEANVEITICSNKTENKYIAKEIVTESSIREEFYEPEEISGLIIENNNESIKFINSKFSLEKLYSGYNDYYSNLLLLNNFYDKILNSEVEFEETDEIIIGKYKNQEPIQNTYYKFVELTFNKKEQKIEKLEVKNEKQKTVICILYRDIEINCNT